MPRWLLLCCTLVLGACTTLGPDYQQPEVAWLEKWRPTSALSEPAASEWELTFWWRLFEDPVLNRLIEMAQQDNLTLRIAGLRILESRALLGIAGSTLYPQLQQANGAVAYVNQTQGGNNDSLVRYQVGFDLAWELDFWGRFQRGIEAADAVYFTSVANQQDVQVLLVAQIADLYFALRTTELRIGIARQNATIQKRSLQITERLFASGSNSELDVQQAKTQYLSTLSTIPQLEVALVQLRNGLGVLLGRPPGALPELVEPLERLPDIGLASVRDMPASLLLRRPDVRVAAWQVAAQSAQIGIAEADFYLSITLLGSLGWSGSSLSGSSDVTTLGVGPALSWNLFDHGRISNNVRVQDARLQQLIEAYQQKVLQAAREIDDALISIVKSNEQQQILDDSVVASRRALELANSRYREGYADFQRVLDSQRAVASQEERNLLNQGSHVSSVIALYKALGGGWSDRPMAELIPAEVRQTMRQRTDWGDLLTTPLPEGSASDSPPATKAAADE
ncbi:MAG: efflux transporter outer membrane subunit [Halopseudomonas sp.]